MHCKQLFLAFPQHVDLKTYRTTTTMAPKTKTTSKEVLLAIIGQVSQLNNGNGADKEIVATRAGYPDGPKSSAFTMAITRLRKKEFLTVSDDGLLRLTESGRELAGNADIDALPSSNQEQHQRMRESLSAKQKLLFQQLTDGQPQTREYLARALGYESHKAGAFTMLLGRTKKLGYLDYIDKVSVQLTDMAFPLGRP